jgi:hypothetical protein
MNMLALTIVMNKAANQVFLDGHPCFLICFFLFIIYLFILFLFLLGSSKVRSSIAPINYRHLACVHHLLDTISECLMAPAYMFSPHRSTMSERSYTHL